MSFNRAITSVRDFRKRLALADDPPLAALQCDLLAKVYVLQFQTLAKDDHREVNDEAHIVTHLGAVNRIDRGSRWHSEFAGFAR